MWIIKIIIFNAFNVFVYKKNTDASILVYKFHPENWFQYVRREYEISINFPRIITLVLLKQCRSWVLVFLFGIVETYVSLEMQFNYKEKVGIEP